MAVEDLNTLRQQLPEVFEDMNVPDSWDDEWFIVPVEEPESGFYESDQVGIAQSSIEDILSEAPSTDDVSTKILEWGPDNDLPDFGGSEAFPGGPLRKRDRDFYPPPDAFAFYLPFHFFYPRWWGIYLVLEPTLQLSNFVRINAHGALSAAESMVVTRIFLYAHEAFHHIVESFATRLEITHREVRCTR